MEQKLKLSSTKFIMGLVVINNKYIFMEWELMDVVVLMDFQTLFSNFNI